MKAKNVNNGDKYLNIMIPFGGVDLEFVAFQNHKATPENRQPNFRIKGGGAVWVLEKKGKGVK